MNKHFILFFLFTLSAFCGQAKKLVDGYIITVHNDTIQCQLVLPGQFKNRYDMYQRIEAIDNNTRKRTTYYAKDRSLTGFGFDYDNKPQCYVLRKEGSEMLFEYREMSGKRLNLYSYCTFTSCGVGSPARVKMYVMESHTLDVVRIHTGLFSSNRQNIRDFLYNDRDLIPLFDETVSRLADIRNFVTEANRLYN